MTQASRLGSASSWAELDKRQQDLGGSTQTVLKAWSSPRAATAGITEELF